MMTAPIVLDLLRLFLGAASSGPRGIDRVDLAYARFLFENWPGECMGLLPTAWGLRLYHRRRVLRGLDKLEELWREQAGGPDVTFASVLNRLSGTDEQPSARRPTGQVLRSAA